MVPQNPITRLERVAKELGELANDLGDSLGADAERVLKRWREEIRAAIDELQRQPG